MICGELLYEDLGADPTRIPAQLLSGIGFLGAGTILRDGFNVKGLTTAAGLLAVTCIGLIVGAGFYIPAIIATFVVYCVLSYSHILSINLEHYYFIDLKIASNTLKEILEDIRKIFNKEKLEIMKMKIIDEDDEEYIKAEIKYREKVDVNNLVAKIMAIDSVSEVIEVKSAE
jgi:putative Mg2+ transporter-C (MgtC) family protein